MESSGGKSNSKWRPRAVAAAVLLGGAYLAWSYVSRRRGWRKRNGKDGRVLMRSTTLGAIHGGTLALERMVDFHSRRSRDDDDEADLKMLETELSKQLPNYKELQRIVAKVEMSGKEDKAVDKLEAALVKARKEGQHHEAYEIEMLLVEMLIYKGEFQKALGCKCLVEKEVSDARRPLFQAIIRQMLGFPEEEISNYWIEFNDTRAQIMMPPSDEEDDQQLHKVSDFNQFIELVKALKKDIQDIKRSRNL